MFKFLKTDKNVTNQFKCTLNIPNMSKYVIMYTSCLQVKHLSINININNDQ